MNTARLTIYIFLLAFISGCVTSKKYPAQNDPDLLVHWQFCPENDPFPSNKAVVDDYHDYIQKLPPEERARVFGFNIWFFKDSTGRHEVKIKIPLNGTWWEHDLIYNQESDRIKVIKHANGRYQS